MDDWHYLNIRIQMEELITEREMMIAENQQRIHSGESLAYTGEEFSSVMTNLTRLREVLIHDG